MKRYTRKKVGAGEKPEGFKKFDVVQVFKNDEHTGSYEMAVLFSRKHRDGTFTVQFEEGSQGDIPETDLVVVNRFDRTRKQIENLRKKVIRYTLLVDKTLNHGYPKKQLSRLKEKLGPEYDGKIRFALFSDRPLNENVANLIACNETHSDVGECPFSRDYDHISSPISEDDIINHYNDAAPARAAVDSVPSPLPSPPSPPKKTPGKGSSGKRSSGKRSSGKGSSGKRTPGKGSSGNRSSGKRTPRKGSSGKGSSGSKKTKSPG